MTYEKFEHKVIGMLLEGDDPRLEKLIAQTWDFEVLSRDETEMGFTVKFLSPASIAIDESEGRIFGVEVKISEDETINLELVIKDGLIDRLKGTFTTEMGYADVIKRYSELSFGYKNNKSSEINFHSDNQNLEEVTFVKNIATISKEIDAHILKESEAEKENARITPNAKLNGKTINLTPNVTKAKEKIDIEVKNVVKIENESQNTIKNPDEYLIEEPFTLATPSEVINEIEQNTELIQINKTNQSSKEKDIINDCQSVKKPVITPDKEENSIMMPPSFSIPKAPEAPKSRLFREVALPNKNLEQTKTNNTPNPQNGITKIANSNNIVKEEILDGKAPQGPVSLGDLLETNNEQNPKITKKKLISNSTIKKEMPASNFTTKKNKPDFKNLTPKELSDPNLKINPIDIAPEELESAALSAVDLDEVENSIELMVKKNTELRIITILIVLVTIVILGLIIAFTTF